MHKISLAVTLALAGQATLTEVGAQTPIQVTVNGAPIAFAGTPPRETQGAVLVPLRGVFEALHASVTYDNATRVIRAQKGTTAVTLPLDSPTATVDGQAQTLSQPAQAVGGTTLVPLRFVAQALGAFVQWHAATRTVEIKTQDPHLASLPTPGKVLGVPVSAVVGQLTGVYPSTVPPQITLRVNGQNTAIPYDTNTTFLQSRGGQPVVQVSPDQLKTGDQVTVQRSPGSPATLVTASFGEVRGTIKSIGKLPNGDSVIILNDGTTVELVPQIPITMSGREVGLTDVMPNETIVIRTNPDNKLGYGAAVATQDNPNPTPPPAVPQTAAPTPPGALVVTIDSFSTDVTRPLKSGDVLHATLIGTPGGKASFAVPGFLEDVRMTESSPGRYIGACTVGKNAGVSGAAVLGKLIVGDTTAPLVQAAGLITIDTTGPRFLDVSPSRDAGVEGRSPLIYATLSDENGVGVDPATVQIRLDGRNVTSQATVTPAFFNVRPADLSPGSHQIQVTVADKAGNVSSADWKFTIVDNSLVQSFQTNMSPNQAVTVGQTIRFTLRGQPGGQAEVAMGKAAARVPLREGAQGVYTGEYTVVGGDSLSDAPVTARFSKGGSTVTVPLATALTIDAGLPKAPRILRPEDDSLVGEMLDIEGRASPNETVRVTVDYVSKALGGLFSVNGSVGSKDVVADKDGHWKIEALSLKTKSLLASDRATVFTISALTVDAGGRLSPAVSVKVRRG